MPGEVAPLYTWRSAICESDLKPTVRHVALTLSLYMNERGGSAFPGNARLARDTGLDRRTVERATQTLLQGGWLALLERGGIAGEKRKANRYEARTPGIGPGVDEAPPAQDRPYPRQRTGGTPGTVPPHAPCNSPSNSPSPSDDPFDEWWSLYPRKVGKVDARRAYLRLLTDAHSEERGQLIELLRQAAMNVARYRLPEYQPHPTTLLRAARWCDWTDDGSETQRAANRPRARGDRATDDALLAAHANELRGDR